MSRIYFDRDLDTVAAYWRIHRKDGVTLGFTTHDRDIRFGGILHRAAPGMLPSAIRKTIDLADDEALEGVDDVLRAEIVQIRYALQRIENGTYGTCAKCGKDIARARLEARPIATRCISPPERVSVTRSARASVSVCASASRARSASVVVKP